MRLTEYEYKIKELIKVDRKDPEIYNCLQKMIMMFLQRKKICDRIKDYEDMSYLLAGDIFMDIINGVEINYFLGYLEKIHKSYAKQYFEEHSSNHIQYDDSSDFEELLKDRTATDDYERICNKIYLEQCDKLIDSIMEMSCKYDKFNPCYNNLKVSLILSLKNNKLVSFHLNPEHYFYLKMILTNFYGFILEGIK